MVDELASLASSGAEDRCLGADVSQVTRAPHKYESKGGTENWGPTPPASPGGQWTRDMQRAQGYFTDTTCR
eukprot:6723460-Pyramimonas_sp.AAC.1